MFSVVIPAYNCAKTIERVLNSVVNQTRFDLIDEIIIVNDGSVDDTHRVITEYIKNAKSHKFVYIKQENKGVSKARNRGIKLATGDWIALLDSDDLWHSDKLEKQYNIIKSNENIKFLGCDVRYRKKCKKIKRDYIKLDAKELCIRYTPTTPSVVFFRESGMMLGLFDENMKYAEDINFYQKFLILDSYYILGEDLVDISIEKSFYGEIGLSSNLYEMHKGRNINTKQLYDKGLISKGYYLLMRGFNCVKYLRRILLNCISRIIYVRN